MFLLKTNNERVNKNVSIYIMLIVRNAYEYYLFLKNHKMYNWFMSRFVKVHIYQMSRQ